MGLYNGETSNDIAKRKGLRYREELPTPRKSLKELEKENIILINNR